MRRINPEKLGMRAPIVNGRSLHNAIRFRIVLIGVAGLLYPPLMTLLFVTTLPRPNGEEKPQEEGRFEAAQGCRPKTMEIHLYE